MGVVNDVIILEAANLVNNYKFSVYDTQALEELVLLCKNTLNYKFSVLNNFFVCF